ncbi:MAG: hypothetical protein ACYS9C_19695 [Planctomycetota bacterium]
MATRLDGAAPEQAGLSITRTRFTSDTSTGIGVGVMLAENGKTHV